MTRPAATAADDQVQVTAFLSDPASYPASPRSVTMMETHGAKVFLAGDEAWKIKRRVQFPYMDFSTIEKRRAACEREIEINRIWAPELYLGCVPVTREVDGRLLIGGSGEPVEWAVRMRRFAQSDLVGAVADKGAITPEFAGRLADMVFDSHVKAAPAESTNGAERVAQLVASVSRNLAGVAAILTPELPEAFRVRSEARLARAAPVLDQRARRGLVRRCHGDLHLDNIVMWQGRPMLFDAIEFDEDLATIDTLYDLAFLLMDLDHRGLRGDANIVLNRYLWRSQETLDLDGLVALPLFLGLRAGVRALVASERAEQELAKETKAGSADRQIARARGYMRTALAYLDPPPAGFVAVGGLSGTGKSTLSAQLAPDLGPGPGAVHLRSDLERKSLCGVGETDRLGPEGYAEAVTAQVYDTLFDKAHRVLTAGHGVIVDAVFAKPQERCRLAETGESAGVPLHGLWLTADPETLMQRVDGRRNDASDATSDIVKMQLGYDIGPLSPAWTIIDAGRDMQKTTAEAKAALSGQMREES